MALISEVSMWTEEDAVSGLFTSLSPYTVGPNQKGSEENSCSRSDADANVGVYTFHLTGILSMAALCIVGNSIVIFIMTKECKLNTPLNCFMVSLAFSDLTQGVVSAIYNISHINVKMIRDALGWWPICCPLLMLVVMTLMSSPFNLVGITVVRYMSIRWPLQHQHMLTKKRTIGGILACWMAAFTLSSGFYIRPQPDPWCGICRSELHWHLYQLMGMLVFSAALPFVTMLLLYVSMNRIYRKHVRKMSDAVTSHNQDTTKMSSKAKARERTLSRVSAFLVAYFFFSYLPYVIYTFVYMLCNCVISGYIRSFVRIVLFSNTTVNFFAYIVAHNEFRRGFFRRFHYKKYIQKKRASSIIKRGPSVISGSTAETSRPTVTSRVTREDDVRNKECHSDKSLHSHSLRSYVINIM